MKQLLNEDIQDVTSVEGLDSLFCESHLILTVPEASSYLSIPQSTLYRRIKTGQFETVRTSDKKLRIKIHRNENSDSQVILNFPDGHPSDSQVPTLQLTELVAKLEAANYRIGYLESKVESQQEQLKLLTDNQASTRSRWTRFWNWFFGRP